MRCLRGSRQRRETPNFTETIKRRVSARTPLFSCITIRESMTPADPQMGVLAWLMAGRSGRELLFLLASAFIAGLARGFSGLGAALIFMPLASSVVGPKLAAPLLLI